MISKIRGAEEGTNLVDLEEDLPFLFGPTELPKLLLDTLVRGIECIERHLHDRLLHLVLVSDLAVFVVELPEEFHCIVKVVDSLLRPRFETVRACDGRLDLWDGIMLNVFTSARVGEYIESTAREGSGRGLHYKASLLRGPRQPETHAPT